MKLTGKQFKATEDIFSTFSRRIQYAKAGDIVTLVATHGDTYIVQNAKGVKFPANIKTLEEV